ncbi:EAL domain-containing protein [Clostridium sp. YIM B02551]|uniref:EAL domain-containing protein n=1 Tax=Clostridium sp. YIM B02551 TaxID=2910679 RepID=UPI001EEBAFED|nr:EAL domain-containing protein [Clostridium sp. YIM B02551]
MNWFYNLKIKKKLTLSFIIVALFSGIVGFIGIRNIGKLNENSNDLYKRNFQAMKNISAIKSNLIQINFDIYKIINEKDKGTYVNLRNEIEYLKNQDDSLLNDYSQTISEVKDQELFNEFTLILKDYRNYRKDLFNYLDEGNYDEASKTYSKLNALSNNIIKNTDDYIQFNLDLAKESQAENENLYMSTLISTIFFGISGLIIAIILGIHIASVISEQLKKLVSFAKSITEGNLDHNIDIKTKDEIGLLADSLNKAGAARREYELDLTSNYEELEASYEEITALEEELREKYDELAISEENLKESEKLYKLISEASSDALFDWRVNDNTMHFSDRWFELLGYSRDEFNSINIKELIHVEDTSSIDTIIKDHWARKTDSYTIEYRIKTKSGSYIWMISTGKTIYDKNGDPYRVVASHKDISELKEYQHKLEYMAYHDFLTDLPNRQYLYRVVNESLELESSNNSEIESALIFLDIDNFKYINDTLGHSFGDILISAIGDRLMRTLGDEDTLIRLGGDEFIIFMKDIPSHEHVKDFSESILNIFSEPFNLNNNLVQITTSLGISLFPKDGLDLDELLTKSDIAMYNSKKLGKNNYTFYNDGMNKEVVGRMKIERHLRDAINRNEFYLHYQPQVNLKTNKISSFEALIRWNNPELGFVSPLDFISIAEENHKIIEIGTWVLKTACEFIKEIYTNHNSDCYISVNVSVIQLMQSDFIDTVLRILNETSVSPAQLEIEITESIFIESYELINSKLEQLRGMGVKIALDDFGKGYSSLSYLKQLPITTLKIDKSFIDDIIISNKSSLVENIIDIGHKMDLNVVAEGVETQDQLRFLDNYNCDKIQGYYFSRPVEKEAAIQLINEGIIS